MRWLVEARNRVIKQGELEAHSTARATVRSYEDYAFAELPVPPMIPTPGRRGVGRLHGLAVPPMDVRVPLIVRWPVEEIAKHIAARGLPRLPPSILQRSFLSVERRWVASDLPDQELLEALSHCYGVLSHVVREAHEKCGARYVICDEGSGETSIPTDHLGGRLPCMVLNRYERTALISLSSGVPVRPFHERQNVDKAKLKVAKKRYRLDKQPDPNAEPSEAAPHDMARSVVEISKAILVKDKRLVPVAWLKGADGKWSFYGLQPPEDDADKALLMYLLAAHVERVGATAVIYVSEVWIGSEESAARGYRPTDAPDRKEAILVAVLVKGEPTSALQVEFTRTLFGKIKFSETQELEQVPGAVFWLSPILRLWGDLKS